MSRNGDKFDDNVKQAKQKLEELLKIKEQLDDPKALDDILTNCGFDIPSFQTELQAHEVTIETWKKSHNAQEILGNWYPYLTYFSENRKVSKPATSDLEKALIDTARYVNNINSMKEDQTMLEGFNRNIDELSILDPFKGWIRPRSIRYILGDLKCIDMLSRPEFLGWDVTYPDGTKATITYNKLLMGWMIICRHFKLDHQQKLVAVSSLRRDVTFNDILSIASIKGKVNYQNNAFIPVPLGDECALFFHDAYFNASEAEVINDWFVSFEM